MARAAGCVGLHDLATEHSTTDKRLLFSGDSVCLWLLSLHLHSNFGKSDHHVPTRAYKTPLRIVWRLGKNPLHVQSLNIVTYIDLKLLSLNLRHHIYLRN